MQDENAIGRKPTEEEYLEFQRGGTPPFSPLELFHYELSVIGALGLAKKEESAGLERLVPKRGLFVFIPKYGGNTRNLSFLVSLIARKGISGECRLRPEDLSESLECETPDRPHLVADVEDGWGNRGLSPNEAKRKINGSGRLCYGVWSGLFHAIYFPWVLDSHGMNLVGASYKRDNVPSLRIENGKPTLCGVIKSGAIATLGSPSAQKLIISL